MKITTSIWLTTPLLVLTGIVGQQSSAHAWTKICNKTDIALTIAYARGTTNAGDANQDPDIGVTVHDASTVYKVKGWWNLKPEACVQVSSEPANRVVSGNTLFEVDHLYYAGSNEANVPEGTIPFCIRQSKFEYQRDIGQASKPFSCSSEFYPASFTSFSSGKPNHIKNLTGKFNIPDPDTCKQGYVWREAGANDRVCVTPEVRTQTRNENAAAASRREPNGGPYGPDTCKQGYVWRETTPSDHVCVTPDARSMAAEDNRRAAERRVGP